MTTTMAMALRATKLTTTTTAMMTTMAMAMALRAKKLTMMVTTTTMATGVNDDNENGAMGNDTTGYDDNDDVNG